VDGKHLVLCQQWEDYNRTMGVGPAGFSLHRSESDLEVFLILHVSRGSAGENHRVAGEPYWGEVDESTYRKLKDLYGTFVSGMAGCPDPPDGGQHWPSKPAIKNTGTGWPGMFFPRP